MTETCYFSLQHKRCKHNIDKRYRHIWRSNIALIMKPYLFVIFKLSFKNLLWNGKMRDKWYKLLYMRTWMPVLKDMRESHAKCMRTDKPILASKKYSFEYNCYNIYLTKITSTTLSLFTKAIKHKWCPKFWTCLR